METWTSMLISKGRCLLQNVFKIIRTKSQRKVEVPSALKLLEVILGSAIEMITDGCYKVQMVLLRHSSQNIREAGQNDFVSLDVYCSGCKSEASWISNVVNWMRKDGNDLLVQIEKAKKKILDDVDKGKALYVIQELFETATKMITFGQMEVQMVLLKKMKVGTKDSEDGLVALSVLLLESFLVDSHELYSWKPFKDLLPVESECIVIDGDPPSELETMSKISTDRSINKVKEKQQVLSNFIVISGKKPSKLTKPVKEMSNDVIVIEPESDEDCSVYQIKSIAPKDPVEKTSSEEAYKTDRASNGDFGLENTKRLCADVLDENIKPINIAPIHDEKIQPINIAPVCSKAAVTAIMPESSSQQATHSQASFNTVHPTSIIQSTPNNFIKVIPVLSQTLTQGQIMTSPSQNVLVSNIQPAVGNTKGIVSAPLIINPSSTTAIAPPVTTALTTLKVNITSAMPVSNFITAGLCSTALPASPIVNNATMVVTGLKTVMTTTAASIAPQPMVKTSRPTVPSAGGPSSKIKKVIVVKCPPETSQASTHTAPQQFVQNSVMVKGTQPAVLPSSPNESSHHYTKTATGLVLVQPKTVVIPPPPPLIRKPSTSQILKAQNVTHKIKDILPRPKAIETNKPKDAPCVSGSLPKKYKTVSRVSNLEGPKFDITTKDKVGHTEPELPKQTSRQPKRHKRKALTSDDESTLSPESIIIHSDDPDYHPTKSPKVRKKKKLVKKTGAGSKTLSKSSDSSESNDEKLERPSEKGTKRARKITEENECEEIKKVGILLKNKRHIQFTQYYCYICEYSGTDYLCLEYSDALVEHIRSKHTTKQTNGDYLMACPVTHCDHGYVITKERFKGNSKILDVLTAHFHHMTTTHQMPLPDYVLHYKCHRPNCSFETAVPEFMQKHASKYQCEG